LNTVSRSDCAVLQQQPVDNDIAYILWRSRLT